MLLGEASNKLQHPSEAKHKNDLNIQTSLTGLVEDHSIVTLHPPIEQFSQMHPGNIYEEMKSDKPRANFVKYNKLLMPETCYICLCLY